MNQSHEDTLIEIEAFFCSRMTELMDQGLILECDSLFEEFIINEKEPQDSEWIFITST